jgi:hypothetical protein
MKTLSTTLLIIGLSLLLSGMASGIDKSKKTDKPKKDTSAVNIIKQDKPKAPENVKKADPPSQPKTYDNFIDRNNNGIDDRAEKSTTLKQPKKKEPPTKTPKKNPTP